MKYTVVTGPTRPILEDRNFSGDLLTAAAPSFEERLNQRLAELDALNALDITVECQPLPTREGWHVAYIRYQGEPSAATLTVRQAAARTGFGRTTIQEMVRDGRLRAVRAGRANRRIQIPAAEIDRFLAGLPASR